MTYGLDDFISTDLDDFISTDLDDFISTDLDGRTEPIETASGELLHYRGAGTAYIPTLVDGVMQGAHVKDVHYVPELSSKLLSLGGLTQQGSIMSVFSPSYEKLSILRDTARARSSGSLDLVLPERPVNSATDAQRYIDGTICILSESLAYSYEHHAWDACFDTLDMKVDQLYKNLDTRVDRLNDKVDYQFKYIQKQFAGISKDITGFKVNNTIEHHLGNVNKDLQDVKEDLQVVQKDPQGAKKDLKDIGDDIRSKFQGVKKGIEDIKDEIRSKFEEASALARNGLISRLFQPIAKVRGVIPDEIGVMQHLVAPDFPTTVRRFWLFTSNIPALQRLAKQYEIEGWQDWDMDRPTDGKPISYTSIDVAVSAHPELCLQILAATWGLQYRDLERPMQSDTNPTGQKRKASDGSESRRVRHKVDEVSIMSDDKGEVLWRSKRNPTPKRSPPAGHLRLTMEELIDGRSFFART